MKQEWFYPAQEEASEQLRKRFQHLTCNFQIIDFETKRHVIEQYTCFNENEETKTIQVQIVRNTDTAVSVMIHELKWVQGWRTETTKKELTVNNIEKS